VGILAPSGQVSGKDSSSGHLGHDPLAVLWLAPDLTCNVLNDPCQQVR